MAVTFRTEVEGTFATLGLTVTTNTSRAQEEATRNYLIPLFSTNNQEKEVMSCRYQKVTTGTIPRHTNVTRHCANYTAKTGRIGTGFSK